MIYSDNDTIAAVSTPAGSGGIAIIRLSGQDAFSVADKIICGSKSGVLSAFVTEMGDHTIAHGFIFDPDSRSADGRAELIDECLVSKMAAPKTYTTENIVEINSHGGYSVVNKTLELLLKAGARAAEPGEFTKRAFLGGRIDLSSAEAVMDVISAKTDNSRRAAVSGLSGRIGREISDICAALTGAMAGIDVSIEYPEYEFDEAVGSDALTVLDERIRQLKKLSSTYSQGKIAKEGIRMVLAGSPNAGKSTLMNLFCGTDRSIVTDVPGTTRDLIEEQLQLFGFPVTITDTAGLRSTADIVEKIGVDRAKDAAGGADLLLYVIDADSPSFPEATEGPAYGKIIYVINKTDLRSDVSSIVDQLPEGAAVAAVSALTGEGVEELFDQIKGMFLLGSFDFTNETVITSKRHKQLIDEACSLLELSLESSKKGMPLDLVAEDLRLATEKLCEILGKNISDEVIDSIFQRFCVGK
ncbi:MAG: tRNA uridine-5-carboxymethylaminomethyl(34) synthesis GTPase MnmE [Clostridia bacterium]|nr:tRNA uridine-5-carboxymethylaminomethyl(34) synthesis GTPase MnmE [Clostridia bacterium]